MFKKLNIYNVAVLKYNNIGNMGFTINVLAGYESMNWILFYCLGVGWAESTLYVCHYLA
jgi:hypothetical protein